MPARVELAAEIPGVRGVARAQVVEVQRSRLLAAAVGCLEEVGYARTTVASISDRARVSRRTFYELFANRDECLVAILEDVVGTIGEELTAVGPERLDWCERIREGLWGILSFLDREPAVARVCVVQALCGGPEVLERRERVLARLAAVVDEGRLESARGAQCTPLTAEGLVGAAFTIAYARLLRGERRPLTDLLGELMGMIVLPYLGVGAARREQSRAVPTVREPVDREPERVAMATDDPLGGVAMRLTYRTARVLQGIADHPGASNRAISDHAGIRDPGQVSKLLRRLESLGLLANSGAGRVKGEPNAWALTTKGEQVARSIRAHSVSHERRAA
jgi:AcrR family transcriptional regulator